jgi:hypothetical protein
MPEDMPDRMPEDMPDKMPEDMSDRMPQDLPPTKRIDVMVGITRSKVIWGLKLFAGCALSCCSSFEVVCSVCPFLSFEVVCWVYYVGQLVAWLALDFWLLTCRALWRLFLMVVTANVRTC